MKIEKDIGTRKNPFLLFLPFLVLYILLIIILSENENHGDEVRYLTYAMNLIHGYYSPPYPNIDLGNGPGYSLLIVPFVALNLPLIFIKLMNAVFYYLSIIFIFKSLQQIVSFKSSIIFSLIWALYPNFYEQMLYILPEILASSLIPLMIFATIKAFKSENLRNLRKYLFIAGFAFGFLALIKPIFGYVLIFLIVGILFLLIFNRKSSNYRNSIAILLIALITNLPYLTYTYKLTGKIFYWSSFGGNNLYWMSNPNEGEYGDWIEFPVSPNKKYRVPGSESVITKRHQNDFDEILKNEEVKRSNIQSGVTQPNLTKGIIQDDLFKEIAINNIKSHPIKFLENCISNAGRMFFNYPASYVLQKPSTLRRLPINGTLIILSLFCLIPTFLNWRKIFFPVRFFLFFAFLYFGGSILGSADIRMFVMVVPILLIWIAFIFERCVKINLKLQN